MSYSRWTSSRFFTYWSTDQYADKEQLRIDRGDFTALVSYEVCKMRPSELTRIFADNDEEMEELLCIFTRFCLDVENTHNE